MSDEYKVRNIDLEKLSGHVRNKGFLSEEASLHLMDTIRCQRQEIEELEQNSCGDCTDGWRYNRVEGRHACTCMTEMEPYQILKTALEQIYKAGTGEIQIADDDTEGMEWVAQTAKVALRSVSPLDYIETV